MLEIARPGGWSRYDIRPGRLGGPAPASSRTCPAPCPDGIAFATDGSVVIACYRPDVVYRWRRTWGSRCWRTTRRAPCSRRPPTCVFAGPDRDVILVPNIGRWHVTRFRVPGLAGVPLSYPTRDADRRLSAWASSTGKAVLVTGGALGIGQGIVRAFAREGAGGRHRGRRPRSCRAPGRAS